MTPYGVILLDTGDGSSPVPRQAITRWNAELLFTWPLGTHFNDQWHMTQKQILSFQKKKLKMSYAKCRPLCQGPISRLRWIMVYVPSVNPLRPRQNGRHFPGDIFKCILLNEIKWISIKIWPKFVPKGLINNILALIHTVDWHRQGDKPLSEPVMISFRTHICVTRPR